ncbi:xanthine dehydrogenase family protein subunit M [Paracoccus sp. PS-1]|uniref:FAD binding domain-containing protein n=1 Tax=unclassified Paracoccus (in: a-proteobacteria) TaxID=2688777 RepID=UPI0004912CD7|nr:MULTISPECIES: xanthine dehydrogenase family protein subunit M [unclassified Paracoccus (in: a-proteobacteria)]MDQ7261356.1 xanthine dehydrogenase family protein subunit M [Paracoccus sp. PS1]
MYLYETTYLRPATIDEAKALYEAGESPAFLSGGHTLLPAMKGHLARHDRLIDIRRIPELQGIAEDGGRLTIGAAVRHCEVAASAVVQGCVPALAGMVGTIGDVQVRHVGTIGGSLANNDPAADYPSAALALDATFRTDRRELPAAEYFQGLYTTALEPGELLVSVSFRRPRRAGYAKFRNPASRYALAAAFVADHADGVRVAITGAGNDGVFRWREAEEALAHAFESASLDPLRVDMEDMASDMHADAEYRAELVKICTQEALKNQNRVTLF